MRVAFNGVVVVHLDAKTLESRAVRICAGLAVEVGDDNAADVEPDVLELGTKAEHVLIVGDSKVTSDLVLFNVQRADDQNDFSLILQLEKHLKLTVGKKARQHAACVMVVK